MHVRAVPRSTSEGERDDGLPAAVQQWLDARAEEEQKTVMDAWNSWMGQLGSLLKDGGNPFTPASKSISNDGSVGDGGGSASGYSIISADSMVAAIDRSKGCPVLQSGATIAAYETFAVM